MSMSAEANRAVARERWVAGPRVPTPCAITPGDCRLWFRLDRREERRRGRRVDRNSAPGR